MNICKLLKKEVPEFLDHIYRRAILDKVEYGGMVCRDIQDKVFYSQICKGDACRIDLKWDCGEDGEEVADIHVHWNQDASFSPEDVWDAFNDGISACAIGEDGMMICMDSVDITKVAEPIMVEIQRVIDSDLSDEKKDILTDRLISQLEAKTCKEQVLETYYDIGGAP